MMIPKTALSRRTMLRGVGAAIALPLFDSMVPTKVFGATPLPPVRLAFLYVPNGIIHKDWLPKTEGKGYEMMQTMKQLEPFRDDFIVLSNLSADER